MNCRKLLHVVRGEMALVGPRPVTASELRKYYGSDAERCCRLSPALPVCGKSPGRNRLTYQERRNLDLQFVRRRSLGMYVRIALGTLPEVWRGSNSW